MKNAKTLFLIPCIAIGQVLAGTSFLNNNAVLSQATRAAVSANGDSHAIATADPNAASAVLDWTKFNVGSGQQMTFNGGGTTFFNLVDGAAGKSQIDGIINGTAGNVWVINPAGVAFSSTARIDIGGLFAAAAGNISNADALRSGSALLPEFSSFGGLVSSDAGATFSAKQIALLGGWASVKGNMAEVEKLDVRAADKMVIDKVGDGLVSINITDVMLGSDDIHAILGDLNVGGNLDVAAERSVNVERNVTADETRLITGGSAVVKELASGSVDVQAVGGDVYLGTVSASKGDVVASSAMGNVVVLNGGEVKTTAKEAVVSLNSSTQGIFWKGGYPYFTDGDVVVNGTVSAEGEGGDVYLTAYGTIHGVTEDGRLAVSTGDVFVNGSVFADRNVEIKAGVGSVGIGGDVYGGSLVEMGTGYGDINFGYFSRVVAGKAATETDAEVSGVVNVLAGTTDYVEGNVNVMSAVDSVSGIEYNGEIIANGEHGFVQLVAGKGTDSFGSVMVDGRVSAEGENGHVKIFAGYGNGAGSEGDVWVNGEIVAGKNVQFNVFEGTLTVAEGGTVRTTADGSEVLLKGGMKENSVSDIQIDGTVKADGTSSKVFINHGYANNASGTIMVDEMGKVLATGDGGYVQVVTGATPGTGAWGDVIVDGTVSADGKGGEAYLAAVGEILGVTADGRLITSAGGVTVNGNVTADGNVIIATDVGNIEINGTVSAEGEGGGAYLTAFGHIYGVTEDGWLVASTGDVVINGNVFADRNVEIEALVGSVMVDGNVSGGSIAEMRTGYGDINFGYFSRVVAGKAATETDAEVSGMVTALAGMTNNGEGNVNVMAAVDPESGTERRGEIVANGEHGFVQLVAGKGTDSFGSVTVDGRVSAEGENGQVKIFAGYGNETGSKGDLKVDGEIVAGKNVQFNVYEGTLKVADGGTVRTTADGSEVLLKGGMKENSVSDIQIDGTVKADGTSSKVLINHGYANNASGTITVGETGKVLATGDGGRAQVATGVKAGTGSWGNVVIDGEVASAGNVNIEAGVGGADEDNHAIGTKGSLTIASHANVLGGGDIVKLATYDGDLTVEKGATVRATGAGGSVTLRAGDKVNGRGNISVAGSLEASGDSKYDDEGNVVGRSGVHLFTGTRKGSAGNIVLTDDGTIEASGKEALVQIATGIEDSTAEEAAKGERRGDIDIKGSIRSTGEKSQVFVWGGYGDYTKGNVSVSGNVVNDGAQGEIKIWSARGSHSTGNLTVDGAISATGFGGFAHLLASYGDYSEGNLSVSGAVTARGLYGKVEANAAHGTESSGDVLMSGTMDAYSRAYLDVASGRKSRGNLMMSGKLISGGFAGPDDRLYFYGTDSGDTIVACGTGQESVSSGKVTGGMASLGSKGLTVFDGGRGLDATADLEVGVGGEVVGLNQVQVMAWNGNVAVNGAVASLNGKECNATVEALSDGGAKGNVTFGLDGQLLSDGAANVVANGNVRQEGTGIMIRDGYAEPKSLHAAIDAEAINVRVNGDVGSGVESGLAISGNLRAVVDGNASFAAANGEDFHGGGSGAPNIAQIDRSTIKADETIHSPQNIGAKIDGSSSDNQGNTGVGVEVENRLRDPRGLAVIDNIAKDFDDMDSGVVVAKGDLAFYTKGKLRSNGFFSAGGDLTASASSFGELSYLRAGGKLTINNVGKPGHPQIAYFESVNGKEPKINNLPNDMVIFVDGRLAGGNINIMNMFGANEAFLVSTPELKSTQGIFGNPPFLHSDLDVANPMEVSAIDYLIQEVPRLTLSSEFPADVDQKVEANGLSLKDSYWFGQERVAKKPSEATDGKVASAEEE